MSEEAPPVASPVAPPVSEPQAPVQSLSQSQPSRTEESERPAERQQPLELPQEPCKVPMHIPMSNSMLESLPMTHISTTLTGRIWVLNFTATKSFMLVDYTYLETLLISVVVLCRSFHSIIHCTATAAKTHGGSCGNEQSFALSFKYIGSY